MKKLFLLIFMVITATIFGQNKKNEAITRVISTGTEIKLEALDGRACIYDAKKTFSSFIDEDLKNWGLNRPGQASSETLFNVIEVIADGTFIQIFADISGSLDKIVMTQAQIIRFCEKYPIWLRSTTYSGTFFLFKAENRYFVACVRVGNGGLDVQVRQLIESDHVWNAGCLHRVVVPQSAD